MKYSLIKTIDKNFSKTEKLLFYGWKYFLMLLKSVFYALVLTILIAYAIGFRPIIIAGGSMQPTMDFFDIIIIYKPSQDKIHNHDIITYQFSSDSAYCTHRIIEVTEDGKYFTQGDNPNNSPDNIEITYDQVVGKTYYILRATGQLYKYLNNTSNLIAVILSLGFVYLYTAMFKKTEFDITANE